MERDNRLKRARDIERDEDRECHIEKKIETILDEEDCEYSYKESAGDALGVFDFPWLKEGGFVAVLDELLEPHDVFSPCLHLEEIQDAESDHKENSNVDESCMQQDSSLVLDRDLLDYKFDVDDLDCLWSSVIDQPLDVKVCMNKA